MGGASLKMAQEAGLRLQRIDNISQMSPLSRGQLCDQNIRGAERRCKEVLGEGCGRSSEKTIEQNWLLCSLVVLKLQGA